MPLFDWDAPQGQTILKYRFSYYWAATLPLTFIVIVLWTIFFLLPWKRWLPVWVFNPTSQTAPSNESPIDLENSPEIRYRKQTPIRWNINLAIEHSQFDAGTISDRMPQRGLDASQDQSPPVSEDKYIPQSHQKTIFEGRGGLSKLARNDRRRSIQIDRPKPLRSISRQRLTYERPIVIIENNSESVHSSPPSLAVSLDPISLKGAAPDTSPGPDSVAQPPIIQLIGSRRSSLVSRTSSEGSSRAQRDERKVDQSRERTPYHLQRGQRDLDYTFYGPIFDKERYG